MTPGDRSDVPLIELFREETEAQVHVLVSNLLTLERDHAAAEPLEACMRAAHSLKGAARIVGLNAAVRIAHGLEDCFVAAQGGRLELHQRQIDALLEGVDLLARIANTPEPHLDRWTGVQSEEVNAAIAALDAILQDAPVPQTVTTAADVPARSMPATPASPSRDGDESPDRVLRVTAESLNRLLGLAGESLVESRWVAPFADSLVRLKRLHQQLGRTLDRLREEVAIHAGADGAQIDVVEAQRTLQECQQELAARLIKLQMFDRRSTSLSRRLYDEALTSRLRPFADGLHAFPRMVRDVAHALGKQVRLEIAGESTQVDRDILASLDAPLGHVLRNAIDHGIEAPEERKAAGKPVDGVIRLEARHNAGVLLISISDDGRGVDLGRLRQAVVARRLTTAEGAEKLSDAELLEFLFLPGFTMKDTVTEISGRGVGLDVVQDMVKGVRGTVRVTSRPGAGTTVQLQLPVTLSVVRTLLTEMAGEPYAFPLASIIRALKVSRDDVSSVEGRQHAIIDGRSIGLITVHQILEMEAPVLGSGELAVVVIGDGGHTYGVVVDRFLGERELVVQPLDPQLGKVRNIAAGALMEDGSPVLIIDADDLIRSIERIVSGSRVTAIGAGDAAAGEVRCKRVLVVDDSLTVRELERKLLQNHGYDVEVAVDGADGWNTVRNGQFNLVVTDVDMPRMDGIELVSLINKDPHLKAIPVMIVSYKDREEDRRRGLEAGAAHYLTKGSFHDETLVQAVVDLIGEPGA